MSGNYMNGRDNSEWVKAMGPVAEAVLGDRNKLYDKDLSDKKEWRWGTRGSLCVDLIKGTWCDHEAGNTGGGAIDLVMGKKGLDKAEAIEWMEAKGFIKPISRIVQAYDYVDANGEVVFQVFRMDPKKFLQGRPDGRGKTIWGTKGITKFLYRLPQVLAAVANKEIVYIAEGEKGVHALETLGLTATCSPGGAEKWLQEYSPVLSGADVVILPDNDEPGRKHEAQVRKRLKGIAARVRTLELPDLPEKGDVFDWVSNRGTRDALEALVAGLGTAPAPAEDVAQPAEAPKEATGKPSSGQPKKDVQNDCGYITEGSVAQAFADRYGDDLRYCHSTGAWFLWDGVRWMRERTQLAFRCAHRIAREMAADERPSVITAAEKSSFASGVERLARSSEAFAVTEEIWDRDPWLLGTPGGTVELKTGVLRPARREDFITKVTAVAPAPYDGLEKCYNWHGLMYFVANGDDPAYGPEGREKRTGEVIPGYTGFLQRWFGYCLTGITNEHALLFAYGGGGNGKSVWLNTMTGIMGDYAKTASMETFTASKYDKHPTDIAGLMGARIVAASETEEGRSWSEVRITQLTGGDKIAARFMRQDFFEYTPQFKLTIIGNHQPALNSVNEAARRRFNMAPFLNKPRNPDPNLMEKLKEEWPHILRWAIQGCLAWQKHGLDRPEAVTTATNEYFSDQDMLSQFIVECCEAKAADGTRASDSHSNLYEKWALFSKQHGDEPGSSKSFGGKMRSKGYEHFDKSGGIRGKGYHGIMVRTQAHLDAEAEAERQKGAIHRAKAPHYDYEDA